MYIFINSDYNLSKGRVGAQCGHVVSIMVETVIREAYEMVQPPENYTNYMKWKGHCVKIILRATTLQLEELKLMDNAVHFIDNGDKLPKNALTAVAFYPGTIGIEDIAKNYKLL
jgi:peptidyl-tRNA hydrolase